MRQRIWRHLLAAAAGVLVVAGAGLAQPPVAAPNPVQDPNVRIAPVQPVNPQPMNPGAGPVIVQGNGGCNGCPQGSNGKYVMSGGGYFKGDCQFGTNCNNGCGSCKSTAGFVFGSCKSFFDPCGPGSLGGGKCGGKCGGAPIYGHGPRVGYNPCVYDSYLNH